MLEIYGTFGPSCCTKETLVQLIHTGMTGIRLNLSHTNLEDHPDWLEALEEAKHETGKEIDLLIDMKGPELRIGKIEPMDLKEDDILDLRDLLVPSYIYSYLEEGQEILLDDGLILLEAINEYHAKVIRGGKLLPNKSMALKGKEIKAPVLTDSDIENLKQAQKYHVTGIMQPFVQSKEDLLYIQNTLKKLNINLKVYAKIESQSGIDHVEEFLPYCDQIIIARGDLGNAVGLVKLPSVQHYIEKVCHQSQKPYMVVTQMLHSMQEHSVPTRAEVSDIYHAVYNGAQSIMLTGEIAAGKYPLEAMRYFVEVATQAMKDRVYDQYS